MRYEDSRGLPGEYWLLLQYIRETRYGLIRNIEVHDGLPFITEKTKIKKLTSLSEDTEIIKLPQHQKLTRQDMKLINCLKIIENGKIDAIIIQDGLPLRTEIDYEGEEFVISDPDMIK